MLNCGQGVVKVFVRDLSYHWRTELINDYLAVLHPVKDKIPHDLPSEDCICGPTVQHLEDGNVIVHHSLDGRERHEGPIDAAMAAGERIFVIDVKSAKVAAFVGGTLASWGLVELFRRSRG